MGFDAEKALVYKNICLCHVVIATRHNISSITKNVYNEGYSIAEYIPSIIKQRKYD